MLNQLLKSVLSESAPDAVYPQDIFASIDFGLADPFVAQVPLQQEDVPSFAGVINKEDRLLAEGIWVASPSPCPVAPAAASTTAPTRKVSTLKVALPAEEDLSPWVRPENLEGVILPLPYPLIQTPAAADNGSRVCKSTIVDKR